MKQVLIAAPVRNSSKWIHRFLGCLDALDYPNDRLYFAFLEGDSSDDTFEKLIRFARAHSNVWLKKYSVPIEHRIARLAHLRNKILNEAVNEQDYVFWIDSDIVKFPPDMLKRFIAHDLDIIAPYVLIDGQKKFYDTLAFRFGKKRFSPQFPYCAAGRDGHVFEANSVGSCYLVKRKVYDANVRYGDQISEQVSFCFTARDKGFKIWVDPKITVLHVNLEQYGENWH